MKQTTVLALVLTVAAPVHAQSDVAGLLGKYGLRAVSPSPASNFELPSLAGETVALADARGRWVVLTFFATWCAPCRSEMPSLERLHRARADRGVDVIGVAIDGPKRAVRRFVDSVGVTFPVLLDDGGVAARYQANSVPISYVIDPRGHIVGMARGARDWAALTDLVDGLLAVAPPDPDAEAVYADRPVELPSTLVPPSAAISSSEGPPRPGRPFWVDVRITWAGNFEDYLLHPPTIHLPDSVRSLGTSASTRSTDGASVVTYRIDLEASEPGTFALDPVELRYTPRGEQEPVATRITGPTVHVVGTTVGGLPPLAWAGFAVLLLGVGGFLWRRSHPPTVAATDETDDASALFETARRQRVEGDIAGFLSTAGQLSAILGIADDPTLEAAIERARFGGELPPRERLDQLQRRLERQLATRAGDPDAPERDAIRLAKPSGDEP